MFNYEIWIKRPLFFIKIAAFFMFGFCISGCVSAEMKTAFSRDAYVFSDIADAMVLIPFFADDVTSGTICALIYNGLTKVDKDLNITGDLAERWDIDREGRIITFHLRKNVKWHDGAVFSAGDVLFTFETIRKAETRSPYSSGYKDIEKIEVIDDYTVRFYYSQPYAPALLKFGMGIIPRHLFEKVQDVRKSVYARTPIGTGPYKFCWWQSGRYIVLEANLEYFEHIPGIKRYVYRVIPDRTVQFLELVSGGIDAMYLSPYQFIYRSNTPGFKNRIDKYYYLDRSYTYIGYNLKHDFLKDKKVRQALSYGINKREIIDGALLGLAEECTGPFLKGSQYYDDSISGYEYNPLKAAELLKEAGWEDVDGDGILEKNGIEFYITITINQGNQIREAVSVIIQREWRDLGVKADIRVVSWPAFLEQFITKKNFQVIIMGWTIPADPDIYPVWHTSSITEGGLNFVSYSNECVDSLIEEGAREFDPKERGEIYRKIHRYISEDAPYTFLFFPYVSFAVEKRFKGVTPALAGIGHNFIDWQVASNEVKYKF